MKNAHEIFKTLRAFLILFFFMFMFLMPMDGEAAAPLSGGWREALDARTVSIWADAQFLEKMVLNARGRLDVTWLPRSLLKRLEKDRQVDEWVMEGLNFYYSINEETRKKMKGRDVLALRYRADKTWNFDPTELVLEKYQVTSGDILGHPDLRGPVGELPSGTTGTLFVCVPSLKPGRTVTVSLGPDKAVFEVPGK